jgi:hypothetical protein
MVSFLGNSTLIKFQILPYSTVGSGPKSFSRRRGGWDPVLPVSWIKQSLITHPCCVFQWITLDGNVRGTFQPGNPISSPTIGDQAKGNSILSSASGIRFIASRNGSGISCTKIKITFLGKWLKILPEALQCAWCWRGIHSITIGYLNAVLRSPFRTIQSYFQSKIITLGFNLSPSNMQT